MDHQTSQPQVEQQELHKILKQLKILNFWITFFGVAVIATLAIFGFLLYKLVTFVQSTEQQITKIQTQTTQTLDVKSQLCDSALLKNTEACKE